MRGARGAALASAAAAIIGCEDTRRQGPAPPVAAADFDSLMAVAESVYYSGAYDSARVLFARIRERARSEGAVQAEARALTSIGLVGWRTGEYREATSIGEEALQLKLRHGLEDQLARSYNALGLVAYMQNRLTESLEWYRMADSVAAGLGDEAMVFTVGANVALSMLERGQFLEARRRLLEVRAFMAEVDDARLEGNALSNLGMLEVRLGNPVAGLGSLHQAIGRYREVGYETGVSHAMGQLGSAYLALGQPSAALSTLDSALVLAQEQGLRSEEASHYELMAEVYRGAGDFQRAIDLYERALVINAELGADWETGIDYRGQADIFVRLGDYRRGRELATEALEIHRRVGAPLEEMRDLLMLAEVEDQLADSVASAHLLGEASEMAASLGAPIARVEVALAAARINDRHRRSRAVLEELGDVSREVVRGGYIAEWEAAHLRSRAHLRLGELGSAVIAGRRAVETIERVRGRFGSSALRTAFGADKREVYAQFVAVLLRSGEIEEAFEVADGARGRALLEQPGAGGKSRTPGSALEEGELLLRQIDGVEERIEYFEDLGNLTPPERVELGRLYESLPELRSRYDLALVQAAEVDANTAAFLGGRRTDADLVRRSLGGGQLVLDYFVPHQGNVLLFIVSPRDVHVLETPMSVENLSSRVRLARELISRRDSAGRLSGVLRGLHEALIQPVLAAGLAADARELLIVPHDVLTYLPFAALIDETTGRYLVQDYALRVLPSAAALPLLRGRSPTEGARGAAASFAPFPEDLPASEEEAALVATHLGGRTVQGRRATEAALRDALQRSRIVHVATHGELNRLNPVFSRLDLVPGADVPEDDGRLEVHELFALDVRADLVFLSGCETGLGLAGATAFSPGEDYATLSQAFLLAGTSTVAATLWAVEDRASAELVGSFYEALDRRDAAHAMAEAQRALIEGEAWAAPYYWAAYQVAGIDGNGN